MKIAAALCWYDEPVRFLTRCIESLEGVVDAVVHADGAWELMPGGEDYSPFEQRNALHEALDKSGLEQHEIYPQRPLWESQVQKRGILYGKAIELTGCDWLFVIDGDEWVTSYDPKLRDELAQTTENVARVFYETISPRLKRRELRIRRLLRGIPGLTVRETHHGIVTPDGEWLHGPRRIAQAEPRDLSAYLSIGHEQKGRGNKRNDAQDEYYRERARTRTEVF